MTNPEWITEFPAAVTVIDEDGKILSMNQRACAMFEEQGGAALIGTNILDCHPEPARSTLAELMRTRAVNCYTIEKRGKWKMFYQAPWYGEGRFRGFVEISMEIPPVIPHFIRKG